MEGESIRHQIEEWKTALLSPNQNDVLTFLNTNKNAFEITSLYQEENIITLNDNRFFKKVFKEYQNALRETGSPIFGIIQDVLIFELKEKSYKMPFLLASATLKKNRFNSTFQVLQTEDFYVNPLLLKILDIDELPIAVEKTKELLSENGLKVTFEHGFWTANFHPHRFVLQKEFDNLLTTSNYSSAFQSIFGMEKIDAQHRLSPYFLFPADESQRKAIQSVENQNTVIQGPPGTGKSQLISNLIGKTISESGNCLLIAEKSVALQVVYDKLKEKDLHYFSVLYHHSLQAKHLIQSLKNTWHFIENLPSENHVLNDKSALATQNLDFTLQRLKQPNLIGGISFSEFKKTFPKTEKSTYLAIKPTIDQWKKDKEILSQLAEDNFLIFGNWTSIKNIEIGIAKIGEVIDKTIRLLRRLKESELTIVSLDEATKLSGLVSLFFYDDKELPIEIFQQDSTTQKKFIRLYNKFKTLKEKEELLADEKKHWNKNFSLSELQEFITALSSTNRFNIRSRLTRNKLSKFTDLNLVEGKKAIENLVELKQIEKQLIHINSSIRKLGIPPESSILDYIYYTIGRIKSVDKNAYQSLYNLSKNERQNFKKNDLLFYEIRQNINTYFHLKEEYSIEKQLLEIKQYIPEIAGFFKKLTSISKETKSTLQKVNSINELEDSIAYSHWTDFKGHFFQLAGFNEQQLLAKVENIIQSFENEMNQFPKIIQQQIKQKFIHYHRLLQTPARKLAPKDKVLKRKLRTGKSILVKAFDKKRNFPTFRELLESEAKYWIELLHPIFLCSPYSLAKSVPMDYTFDLVLFDEASQIPFNHAVGGIQRGRRVVVSGDEQQMTPSFYFQRKNSYQSDLLHHSRYYWNNEMLTYHYRSKHQSLIEFSNRFFYNNELRVFPYSNSIEVLDVLDVNGRYIHQINEKEAEITARLISEKIKQRDFNFGLVTFNQAQLNCIMEKIPPSLLLQLEGQENVFIHSLENVQGDQCNHLIISLGYGKDENGNFYKRFGPLNQEQGYRRLNVLMSRAISKITFIRSVSSSDFSISDNEGVEMLRKLMLFLEEDKASKESVLSRIGKIKGNHLTLLDVTNNFSSAQEIVDFYSILKERDWKIDFNLSSN